MFHTVFILLYLLTQTMDTAYEVNGIKCDGVNHTVIGHLIIINQWGYIYIYIQDVTGGTDQTSGGCSLC